MLLRWELYGWDDTRILGLRCSYDYLALCNGSSLGPSEALFHVAWGLVSWILLRSPCFMDPPEVLLRSCIMAPSEALFHKSSRGPPEVVYHGSSWGSSEVSFHGSWSIVSWLLMRPFWGLVSLWMEAESCDYSSYCDIPGYDTVHSVPKTGAVCTSWKHNMSVPVLLIPLHHGHCVSWRLTRRNR
jgi:hypothetical protein